MAKHYGVKARGLEIVTSRQTVRQRVARLLCEIGVSVVFKIKVWLGWRVR